MGQNNRLLYFKGVSDEECLAQLAKLMEDYENCVSIEEAEKIFHEIEPYALEGFADAAFVVGMACFEGIYGASDNDMAFQWFSDAASKGSPEAQLMLGAMYELVHPRKMK